MKEIYTVPQFIDQNDCILCKRCCRFIQGDSRWFVSLTEEDINLIGKMEIDYLMSNLHLRTVPFNKDFSICIFFDPVNNLCTIYDVRPFECRLYPFVLHEEGGLWLSAHVYCPWVMKKNEEGTLMEYGLSILKFLNTSEVQRFLRRNMKLFSRYDDVIKIIEIKPE